MVNALKSHFVSMIRHLYNHFLSLLLRDNPKKNQLAASPLILRDHPVDNELTVLVSLFPILNNLNFIAFSASRPSSSLG